MTRNTTREAETAPGERVQTVQSHDLPASVAGLVADYERHAGDRDRFLWKWLHYLFPSITLSSVADEYGDRVRDAKVVASMYVVLLDDLAESRMDRETFEEASKIPFDHQTVNADRRGVDATYLSFAERVWASLDEALDDAPCRDEFGATFAFDVKQNLNAIDYSYLVNQHLEMATLDESQTYDCRNMMLFTYAGIDLMHSPSFDRDEFGTLRSAVLRAQRMARIGNWITTWEREVHEGDYTSGVVVFALENGVVSCEDLYRARDADSPGPADRVVETINDSDVEDIFLHRWQENYAEVKEAASEIRSVDLDRYLDGMEQVMRYHTASRGWK